MVIFIGLVTDALFGLSSIALLTRLLLVAVLAWCVNEKWESVRKICDRGRLTASISALTGPGGLGEYVLIAR